MIQLYLDELLGRKGVVLPRRTRRSRRSEKCFLRALRVLRGENFSPTSQTDVRKGFRLRHSGFGATLEMLK